MTPYDDTTDYELEALDLPLRLADPPYSLKWPGAPADGAGKRALEDLERDTERGSTGRLFYWGTHPDQAVVIALLRSTLSRDLYWDISAGLVMRALRDANTHGRLWTRFLDVATRAPGWMCKSSLPGPVTERADTLAEWVNDCRDPAALRDLLSFDSPYLRRALASYAHWREPALIPMLLRGDAEYHMAHWLVLNDRVSEGCRIALRDVLLQALLSPRYARICPPDAAIGTLHMLARAALAPEAEEVRMIADRYPAWHATYHGDDLQALHGWVADSIQARAPDLQPDWLAPLFSCSDEAMRLVALNALQNVPTPDE